MYIARANFRNGKKIDNHVLMHFSIQDSQSLNSTKL